MRDEVMIMIGAGVFFVISAAFMYELGAGVTERELKPKLDQCLKREQTKLTDELDEKCRELAAEQAHLVGVEHWEAAYHVTLEGCYEAKGVAR
jgi:hypothetical protein